MKIRLSISVVFAVSLCGFESKAQADGAEIKERLDLLRIEYTPVKGFEKSQILANDSFSPRPTSGILNGFDYMMKPADRDVLVVLSFFDADTTRTKPTIKFSYNDTDHIEKINFLINTGPLFIDDGKGNIKRVNVGSTLDPKKVTMFTGKKLARYGADDASIFDVPVSAPFRGKYQRLKVFCMYKKNRGEAWIYYFYNPGDHIDKYVKATEYMLRFKGS